MEHVLTMANLKLKPSLFTPRTNVHPIDIVWTGIDKYVKSGDGTNHSLTNGKKYVRAGQTDIQSNMRVVRS